MEFYNYYKKTTINFLKNGIYVEIQENCTIIKMSKKKITPITNDKVFLRVLQYTKKSFFYSNKKYIYLS